MTGTSRENEQTKTQEGALHEAHLAPAVEATKAAVNVCTLQEFLCVSVLMIA